MKLTSMILILLGAIACLIHPLAPSAGVFAQSTEPNFKVGDRVEANIGIVGGGGEQWTKATVTKIFEATTGGGVPQKDPVIVAEASAVAAQGSDTTIEASRLSELNIPYSKTEALRVKMISRTNRLIKSGKDRTTTIYTIVTDRPYVLYTRSVSDTTMAVSVDETGTILGGRIWRSGTADLTVGARDQIATQDRFFWMNKLLADKIAAGGNWEGKMPGYLVKTDEGKFYLLGASWLRLLTQQ
jgi:hypothetical protein